MIPFADVTGANAPIRAELERAIAEILDTGRFVQGRWVQELEASFAAYLDVEASVALSSGTSALELAMRALDVRAGDEVITTPLTFIATAEAICAAGARPVFVDVDPQTLQMDPDAVAAAIGPRTVGIVPVHLYGAPVALGPLLETANAHGLWIVEDACQAHGARYETKRVGSFGIASCFSFYPGKNLGACGEGGLVATVDGALAERVRKLRDHGSRAKYHHDELGMNARMGEIEAASVALKLPLLDEANERRRRVAARYHKRLAELPLAIPDVVPGGESVHHLFVVRSSERDALRAYLGTRDVGTGLHYPLPLHQQPALRGELAAMPDLPHAEDAARSVLSLPMFPALSASAVDEVCAHVEAFFARRCFRAPNAQTGVA